MRTRLTVVAVTWVLAGCSSDGAGSQDAGADSSDSAARDSMPADSRPTDAAMDASDMAAPDGADSAIDDTAGKPEKSGPCHNLQDVSNGVMPTFQAGSPPTPNGGQLVDGTYVLGMVVQYGGSSSTVKDYGTIRISGNLIERAEGSERSIQSYSISGSRYLDLTYTCHPIASFVGSAQKVGYTATSSLFREYVSSGGGKRARTFYLQ